MSLRFVLAALAAALACAACESGSAPSGEEKPEAFECPVTASEVSDVLGTPVIDVTARIAERFGPGVARGCQFAVVPPSAPSPAGYVDQELRSLFPAQVLVTIERRTPADLPLDLLRSSQPMTCRTPSATIAPDARISSCGDDYRQRIEIRMPENGQGQAEWVVRLEHATVYRGSGSWDGDPTAAAAQIAALVR